MRSESPHTTTRRARTSYAAPLTVHATRRRPRHVVEQDPTDEGVGSELERGRSGRERTEDRLGPRRAQPVAGTRGRRRHVAHGGDVGAVAVELGGDGVTQRGEQIRRRPAGPCSPGGAARRVCTTPRTRRREGTGCARTRSGAGTIRPSRRPCRRPRSTWRRRANRPHRRPGPRSPTRNRPRPDERRIRVECPVDRGTRDVDRRTDDAGVGSLRGELTREPLGLGPCSRCVRRSHRRASGRPRP